jgi:K+-sensing histidine kinase KdpD
MLIKRHATPTIVCRSIVVVKVILKIMNIKEKFGKKVKQLREERQFSIEYLANVSNVDRNYISDIEKGKIFDKFYRGGDESTRKTKGTGLGLYLARKITEAHQGTVFVKDHSPSGSIFTVQF